MPVEGKTLESRDCETKQTARASGYTYRKLLRVDLVRDCCEVLRSEPGGWQPGEGPLTWQLEQFGRSGAVHPEDVERFVEFTRLENLRAAAQSGQEVFSLLYRRQTPSDCRWNLMEVIPDGAGGRAESAILCVKDIHDALWESMEREGVGVRRHPPRFGKQLLLRHASLSFLCAGGGRMGETF